MHVSVVVRNALKHLNQWLTGPVAQLLHGEATCGRYRPPAAGGRLWARKAGKNRLWNFCLGEREEEDGAGRRVRSERTTPSTRGLGSPGATERPNSSQNKRTSFQKTNRAPSLHGHTVSSFLVLPPGIQGEHLYFPDTALVRHQRGAFHLPSP